MLEGLNVYRSYLREEEIAAVDRWLTEDCVLFGESSATSLLAGFNLWVLRSKALRYKLGRRLFSLALGHLGVKKRRKDGLTYYLGVTLRADAPPV